MHPEFALDYKPAIRTDGTLYVKDSPYLGQGMTRYCIKCKCHRATLNNAGRTIKLGNQRHWYCGDHK